MKQVGAVHCRRAGGLPGLMVRRLAVFLLSTWAPVSTAAAAEAEAVDCASINVGRLDVVLASGSKTVRTVEVSEGERVRRYEMDVRAVRVQREAGRVLLGGARGQLEVGRHLEEAARAGFAAELERRLQC